MCPPFGKKKAGALLCSAGLRSSHGSELKAPPSRAGRPVLSDPEEGARPALVRGAPSPARRAGQPAGSAPSIGPRGPGRAAPPTACFSLLIEVCLSRVRSGQRQKPNIYLLQIGTSRSITRPVSGPAPPPCAPRNLNAALPPPAPPASFPLHVSHQIQPYITRGREGNRFSMGEVPLEDPRC